MSDLDTVVDHLGVTRKLACLEPDAENLMMRAGRGSFSEVAGLIGRDKWRQIDNTHKFGTAEYVLDQSHFGACVGFSEAGALRATFIMSGFDDPGKLSGAFAYSLVNGGRDNGAVISDAAIHAEAEGICLQSECELPHIFANQVTTAARASAKRHRLRTHIPCSSFDEMGTAIQRGLAVQFPIRVGRNFEQFANGVAGFERGAGNHSVFAHSMINQGGKWYLLTQNSWTLGWGPFKNGHFLVSEQHIQGAAMDLDAFVLVDPILDAQGGQLPVPA